ncbi:MAG: DNA alkylation repair protein [Saprospiraceae bacterium]
MQTYLNTLQTEFQLNANPEYAAKQKAYMRNQFEFFGLNSTERRTITKPFMIREFLPDKSEMTAIVLAAWEKPERDFHYFAQEFAFRYKKQFEENDIELFEYMITHQSWWDTIDFIASKLVNEYFKRFPKQRDFYVDKWLASDNIWLQRTTLYFQVKHKKQMDLVLLTKVINVLASSDEFFIQKAIGTVLREYSRIDADWVVEFVNTHDLSKLSEREALRLL